MDRTLVLHIGHYKTGTTAIQTFCQHNRSLLAEKGVNYAQSQLSNAKHSAFAFSLLDAAGAESLMHGYKSARTPEEIWEELFAEVRNAPQEITLISSEEFMRLAEFPEAARRLQEILATAPDISFRVLVWLRSPGAHLTSWYNQLIKMQQVTPTFETALGGSIEKIHYDYGRALAPWSEIFGSEALEIRRYPEDKSRPHVLIEQALKALGVEPPETVRSGSKHHNPRLDDRVLEAVRMLQNAGLPRHTVENARRQMLSFLEREDRLAAEGHQDLSRLEDQAREGLQALSGQGQLSFDPAEMMASLPKEHPGPSAEMMVASFVMTEFVALRRRINLANLERLDALEERVAKLEQANQGTTA